MRPYRRMTALSALLLVLGLAASSSLYGGVSCFLITVAEAASAPPSTAGSINSVFLETFQRSLLAYQLDNPTFAPTLTVNAGVTGPLGGMTAASSGLFDFTVTSNSAPDTLTAAYPSLKSYPIMIAALTVYYSLPKGTIGTGTVTASTLTFCRIWRSNITMWNDPELVATNPTLTLPAEPIVLVLMNFGSDGSLGFARLCTKVDPVWASTPGLGISNNPTLLGVSFPITAATSGAGLCSKIIETPGAIGFASSVPAMKALKMNLINQAGKVVSPTPATSSQAFLELAANGILPGGNGFDLSNAQSAYAWPANIAGWVIIDTENVRSTCAAKATVLKFLLWVYTSEVVAELAGEANLAMPPALYLSQSGLLNSLRTGVLCDGAAVASADSTGGSIRGSAIIANQIAFLTAMYRNVDSTYKYAFTAMADALALSRISVLEIDFAVVSTDALTDQQIDDFRSPTYASSSGAWIADGGMILPAYLVGVVATFSLPTLVTSLAATRTSSNDLGLPDLYPLLMNTEVLAAIFAGHITSWIDMRMTDINPQLIPWFARVPLAPTTIFTVVCCTVPDEPLVAATILARAFAQTNVIQTALGATGAAALTASTIWPTLLGLAAMNQSYVDRETTSSTKIIMQPGSISYRPINTAATALSTDFQMRTTNKHGVMETVAPTPAAMASCISASTLADPALFSQLIANPKHRNWVTNEPGCYPLTALASLALGRSFSAKSAIGGAATATDIAAISATTGRSYSNCVRAQKNLELLRWIQVSPVLSTAARNSGLVRLSDFAAIRSYLVDSQLNSATCDGHTILITLPIVWAVPTAATVFTIVAAIFVALFCWFTIGMLWRYRTRPAIRGASPIFLAQVAVGLALVAGSLVAWASPVTHVSCLSFQWLVNLGFTLAFAPLFAKTWRIYQIFSAKKIKVVKITNSKLIWVVAAMLAFELVVLTAWTAVSPLQPVLFERPSNQADGAIRQTTHCAMEGASGSAFLAIEGCFKGVLLFLGSMYGFSTRKVSAAFNESQTIAWAIYNVVFSGIVVSCILAFLNTIGDTLIWLVLMLLLWIVVATWCFVFVPKFSAVFTPHDKLGHRAGQHPSMASSFSRSGDGAMTFTTIAGFTVVQLQAYKASLEAQLEKVRRVLGLSQARKQHEVTVLSNSHDRDNSQHHHPAPVAAFSANAPTAAAAAAPSMSPNRTWTRSHMVPFNPTCGGAGDPQRSPTLGGGAALVALAAQQQAPVVTIHHHHHQRLSQGPPSPQPLQQPQQQPPQPQQAPAPQPNLQVSLPPSPGGSLAPSCWAAPEAPSWPSSRNGGNNDRELMDDREEAPLDAQPSTCTATATAAPAEETQLPRDRDRRPVSLAAKPSSRAM